MTSLTGLLYQSDNPAEPLTQQLETAVHAFQRRYSKDPIEIHVHPSLDNEASNFRIPASGSKYIGYEHLFYLIQTRQSPSPSQGEGRGEGES